MTECKPRAHADSPRRMTVETGVPSSLLLLPVVELGDSDPAILRTVLLPHTRGPVPMQPPEKDMDAELACSFSQEQGLCSAHTRHPAPSPVLDSRNKGAKHRAEAEVGWAGLGSPSLGLVLAPPLPSFLTYE